MKNYGLDLQPMLPEDFLGGTDRSLETKFGSDIINPSGDWTPYTPSTEDQDTSDGDTYACCTFGTSNAIEMLARLRFNENINLSDRFIAKKSGTVVGRGNDPKVVAEYMRPKLLKPLYWSVNESEWPDVDTVEEYYQEPPSSLDTVAVARGAEFDFGYQFIPNTPASIKQWLKKSPVCIAVTAWMERNGVYVRIPGISENHWTTVIKVLDNGNYLVFDSFAPFLKEVSPDACRSVAMSYYLNRHVEEENWFKRFLKEIIEMWKQVKQEAAEPPISPAEAPSVPVTPPTTSPAKESHLERFCLAIRTHEGWFPGSRSQKNNNPGNCRYSSVGYALIYEPVLKDKQGFAVFKTYELGWLYLNNLVKSKIAANPKQTIQQFFSVYAPTSDGNDPVAYAKAVCAEVGLKPTDPISKIL